MPYCGCDMAVVAEKRVIVANMETISGALGKSRDMQATFIELNPFSMGYVASFMEITKFSLGEPLRNLYKGVTAR